MDEYIANLKTLTRLEADLEAVEARLADFLGIDPAILISPFRSEVNSIATVQLNITDFFSPAVIVLLLQHLTVTFAALSMVRERKLGAMELFYVSPLSAIETLLGKYLSYLIFGAVLAVILMALVIFGLGAPMLGQWWAVSLVIMALLFASLGIGFVISLISKTDTQAVQYSMIVLLTSVFFSGFILGLDTLWQPVRIISWTLPATYGILMLRDIMLTGDPLAWGILLQLIVIGGGLCALAWVLLRRSMAHS
jgi:ABC-2 type transport system permease protein